MTQGSRTPKTRFTRMCIGEAIVALLKDGSLSSLRISQVVRKAGVSRMTFYKYYISIQDALEDYLQMIVEAYVQEGSAREDWSAFQSQAHILHALLFFDRYSDFFLTMKHHGLYGMLIDRVNDFIANHVAISERISPYKRYAYAGGLLNCFIQWQQSGKEEEASRIARTIYELYGAK